jgi:LysR family transcriptional regulator, glycine cleavage system transcriptional activator
MSRPPLHALQGFVAAARLRNLSRAADSLHLTVSALSHQMRTLEGRLGYPLLVRTPRGVEPTAEGQRLLDRIGPHLDGIAAALQPYAARREDVLTISATPSMASAWLVPRLGGFLAAHPTLEINLQSTERVVAFDGDSQVDAALRIGRGQWPGTVAEHLFDEWLVPMASPALVARMAAAGDPPLSEWPLLGDPDGQWTRWFAHAGGAPPARFVASLDDSEAHHRAALDGVGVALGRLTRARLLLDAGQLVLLSRHRLKTDFAHYLVHPPRVQGHRGFLAFRDWLRVQAAEHAAHMAAGAPAAD